MAYELKAPAAPALPGFDFCIRYEEKTPVEPGAATRDKY
jgi:hypothetical protein